MYNTAAIIRPLSYSLLPSLKSPEPEHEHAREKVKNNTKKKEKEKHQKRLIHSFAAPHVNAVIIIDKIMHKNKETP